MYKKAHLTISSILATVAILTVLSSGLHTSYAQSNHDLEKKILDVHNKERSAVGIAPLTWSNSLADGAQAWANHLATTGKFVHDPVHTGVIWYRTMLRREHCRLFQRCIRTKGGTVSLGQRKVSISWWHVFFCRRSLHSDGLG